MPLSLAGAINLNMAVFIFSGVIKPADTGGDVGFRADFHVELRVRPREDLFSIGPLKRFDCWSLVRGEALCSAAPSRWTTPGLCVGCDKELLRLAALWRRLMRMFDELSIYCWIISRLDCCAKEKLQVTQNITVTWLFLEPASKTTLFCVGPKIKSN